MMNNDCVDSSEKDDSSLLDTGEDSIPGMVLSGRMCSNVHHTRYYGVCYAGVDVIDSGGFSLSIL
jgi:hypothetical protein